jgi:hypothetical protein
MWRGAQVVYFSPPSCHFVPHQWTYSLQYPVIVFLLVREATIHPIQTSTAEIVLYIRCFVFSRHKDRSCCSENCLSFICSYISTNQIFICYCHFRIVKSCKDQFAVWCLFVYP